MKILGIIPARFASSRFSGKPLVDIGGKTMIQRVYEQAKKASALSEVIVATDDKRIFNAVKSFGGIVVMTASHHANGTERCAEIAQKYEDNFDAIINIQGDEPFIFPEQINQLAQLFLNDKVQIGTLIKKIEDPKNLVTSSIIKVVVNKNGEALYFSRNKIPFIRNEEDTTHTFYKHIGIYGYRKEVLKEIVQLPVSSLEKAESLEQLRWLENGYKITTGNTEFESHSIDVPEDLKRIQHFL